MDSQAIPLRHYSSAKFLFDRESPFAPLPPKKDTPTLASQTSSQSSLSSPSPLRTQHRYCLTNGNDNGKGNDQPWLTLLVSSRSPKQKFLPLFIGKDTISGVVELDLAKPETVREVKVTVRAVFPTSSYIYILQSTDLQVAEGRDNSLHRGITYVSRYVKPSDETVTVVRQAVRKTFLSIQFRSSG